MNRVIRNVTVSLAMTGAFALWAQAPATPAPAAQTPDAQSSASPTADDIVARYIDAIGGKEAIGKVKSISMEMAMQVMGSDAPSKAVLVDGVGYKMETEFNGTKIVQCYTDKGGWMVNPMAGANDPTPMPEDQYLAGKGQIYVGGPLYNYAAKGSKAELVSKDADSYKIRLTSKDNVDQVFVIDPKTYLIKTVTGKTKMQGQEVEATTTLSDYRKTDAGYMLPYSIAIDFGGFALNITVKNVELNKNIDPAVFEMPKAAPPAAAPGPSM
ncbi:hypothetical protein DYQ86_25265 [Acidobacteria bacterium AB60]|nr:hypothetical protein DYQ86_25265 [Acidobacteria bacterium AB60]